jgi:hypothetical protein
MKNSYVKVVLFVVVMLISCFTTAFGDFYQSRPFSCIIEKGLDTMSYGQLTADGKWQSITTYFSAPTGTTLHGMITMTDLYCVGDSVNAKILWGKTSDGQGGNVFVAVWGANIDPNICKGNVTTTNEYSVIGTVAGSGVEVAMSTLYYPSVRSMIASTSKPAKPIKRPYGYLFSTDNRWPLKGQLNPSRLFKDCTY